MVRDPKPTGSSVARAKAEVSGVASGPTMLVTVAGLVDEHFAGFGNLPAGVTTAVIDISKMTRMTSFGVRQWLKAIEALPKSIDLYLLGCPSFFIEQLNMVLNLGGSARVVTVQAPYMCPRCSLESTETVDVLAERATLAKGIVSEKNCQRCGSKIELDETPESYFSFVMKYAASSINPAAAALLAERGLYASHATAEDKPPKIIKLVHVPVTYFRIIGTIGSVFRARPFLVGAEGEVVIDLAEVDRFDPMGLREWRRMLKTLAGQVPAITLVDVPEPFLLNAADSPNLARNISVWSVLAPYRCVECHRPSRESQTLANTEWPPQFADHVCAMCGGTTRCVLALELLAPLQKAATSAPPASAKVIAQRAELLSRALTDANVARAGDGAAATLTADDTILDKYKIVRRLSSGGMAEIFLAKQVGIGGFEKPVALKRIQRKLLDTRHLAVDMFLNEAKIAGRLVHPNIVQVLDVGEVDGALYLAMEYVRGKDLRDVVKLLRASGKTMPLGEACYIVREVAHALHHAYWSTDLAGKRLSVVHRDVSPHNIILGYDGTVKLLDFGVAMSSVTEAEETMIVGKWLYMSPEHTARQNIDHRSDLFSLGTILYLLCSGTMPFSGTTPKEIVKKIRAGAFRPLEQAAPGVPPALAALVRRMLSPNPDARPQTGAEVVTALNEVTRSLGIDSSTAYLANFLTDLFPADGETASNVEHVRSDRPSNEFEASSKSPVSGSPIHRISQISAAEPASSDESMSITRQRDPLAEPAPVKTPATMIAITVVVLALLAVVAYVVIRSTR